MTNRLYRLSVCDCLVESVADGVANKTNRIQNIALTSSVHSDQHAHFVEVQVEMLDTSEVLDF